MIPFEHYGAERPLVGCIRSALIALLLTVGAVVLFPFTLLGLFFRALGFLGDAGRLSR